MIALLAFVPIRPKNVASLRLKLAAILLLRAADGSS